MNNYEYEQYEDDEINLRDAFFYILRHLKQMLIVGLVCMLLLGGYKGYKSYKETVSNNAEYSQEEIDKYNSNKDVLTSNLDLKQTILMNYVNNSDFLSLDPYSDYQAKATYYVDTDYKIITSSTYQDRDYTGAVLSSYVTYLTSDDVISKIADKYDVDDKYVSEFVNVYTHDYMVDINVYSSDKEEALNILHDLEDELPAINEIINSSITNNTLTLVNEVLYEGKSTSILSKQQDSISSISSTLSQISDVQTKINKLESPGSMGDAKSAFIKSFVKFGIIGLVVGVVLVCGYYFVKFLMKDTVYSADELKDKTGIRLLGNIASTNKTSKYINWINKLEHRTTVTDYGFLAANINAFSTDNNVLLCGDVDDKENITSNLKDLIKDKNIVLTGSLNNDVNAVEALKKCDDVVLLVKCNKSNYDFIKEEKKKLSDLKKNIVGCIVSE